MVTNPSEGRKAFWADEGEYAEGIGDAGWKLECVFVERSAVGTSFFFLRYRLETPMDPMFPPALDVCSRRMLCKNSWAIVM